MRIPSLIVLTWAAAFGCAPAFADDIPDPALATRDAMIQACQAKELEKKTTKTELEMRAYCLDQVTGLGRLGRHVPSQSAPAHGG